MVQSPVEPAYAAPTTDPLQDALTSYVRGIRYEGLSPAIVDAVKVRVVDTIGCVYAGLDAEPCVLAREVAAELFPADQASVIGVGGRTTVDMAAFVNGTAARYGELNDMYHRPHQPGGHPSDIVLPLLAVAEFLTSSGAEFLGAVATGYEVVLDLLDAAHLRTFDSTNLIAIGIVAGASQLLGLNDEQVRQAVSMTVVPNNALRRSRIGALSMWKAAASGQAGRAAVFAALLASHGFEGPTMPFTGEAGWVDNVACADVHLDAWDPSRTAGRVADTLIKPRGACGTSISSIMAAERAFDPGRPHDAIEGVVVETYEEAVRRLAQPHAWEPQTRESADHSIPYVVAATLTDGTVGPAQFDDAHLSDPRIRALMRRLEVRENPSFTAMYEQPPYFHRTRVRLTLTSGEEVVGDFGAEHGDFYDMPREDVEQKFVELTRGPLGGEARSRRALERLWDLDMIDDVAGLVPLLIP